MITANTGVGSLNALLESGDLSSVELCQHYFEKISQAGHLNAFITLCEDEALSAARTADDRRAAGDDAPLLGVPLVHKDVFCTQGILTTCGSKILGNYVSPYDATVVSLLKRAGMITLGKTNMDEFAMGSSTEHSYFKPTLNPWDTSRVPGGSSGGSAVAVSAGLAPAATGTDTGGSIRQPAAFCGITGIKPSYGRVSRFGLIAFASSLDQAGVFARSAADTALLLDAIACFDPKDSTSLDVAQANCHERLNQSIKGLRVGVPKEFFDSGLQPDIGRVVHEALADYQKLGAQLIDVELPNSSKAIPSYYVIAPAEASSNLSRFDGVRYGYRASKTSNLQQMYRNTRSEGFGAEVRRRILIGTYVLSHGYYDAYYVKAQKIRRLIAQDYERAFEQCDIIMGPTTPTTAFELGAKTDDPVAMYLNDIYTASVNLAGLPAVSIPCGFDNEGLPVGLQIIGKYLEEAKILNVAHQIQTCTDYHQQTPGDLT